MNAASGTLVRPRTLGRGAIVLAVVYFALAVGGLIGTWYFNLRFTPTAESPSYLEGWFANPASSSAAVDVIVAAIVACLLYLREGWRLGGKWIVFSIVLVPLTFVIALAFTFPLFLGVRELVLARALARARRP